MGGSAWQGPPYRRGWDAMGADVEQCRGNGREEAFQ